MKYLQGFGFDRHGVSSSARQDRLLFNRAEVLADGPTGLFMLDETGGTVAADTSGNGRDGTYESGAELGAEPVIPGTDRSLYLPGAPSGASMVTLGEGGDFCGSGEGNSIEVVFSAPDVERHQVLTEVGAEANGLSLQIAGGFLHAVTAEAPNTISIPIEPGTPYFAAGVWKTAGYIAMYLEGEEIKRVSPGSDNTLDAGQNPCGIGAVNNNMVSYTGEQVNDTGNLGFGGRIGPVAFFDKVLPPERVAAHASK